MQQTTANYLKALKILFIALVTGQALFAVIAYVLKATGTFPDNTGLMSVFMYFVPALDLVCILASYLVSKKKISLVDANLSLTGKLNTYRAISITRWAMIEGGTLFTIIAYLLTGAQMFLVLMSFMILVSLTLSPTVKRIVKELPLSSGEQDILNDPNGLIG
jgi:hypothetical protein